MDTRGDWNGTPQELAETGWLQKVGGTIHAPNAATCNESVYDFFVVKSSIADGAQCTRKIGDAGYTPHSPARLVFKGIPRKVMVRQIKSPPSVPAVPPHDPMQEQPPEPDDLIALDSSIEEDYASVASDTARILLQLQGEVQAEDAKESNANKWDQGVRFCWRNLADPLRPTWLAPLPSRGLGGILQRGSE